MNYKPLPDSLTIKKSNIQGLGLFAVKTIAKNTDLGMIHFSYGELLIRTPLGGFIHHSLKPNCKSAFSTIFLNVSSEEHLLT